MANLHHHARTQTRARACAVRFLRTRNSLCSAGVARAWVRASVIMENLEYASYLSATEATFRKVLFHVDNDADDIDPNGLASAAPRPRPCRTCAALGIPCRAYASATTVRRLWRACG